MLRRESGRGRERHARRRVQRAIVHGARVRHGRLHLGENGRRVRQPVEVEVADAHPNQLRGVVVIAAAAIAAITTIAAMAAAA